MIIVIVLFAITMGLFGLWAKSAVIEKQRMTSRGYRVQAERLAEAGLARAVARRAADPQYQGEIWSITAAELGGRNGGEVRIRFEPTDNAATQRVEAVAEFPAGAVRQIKFTKHRVLLNAPAGNEP
jgi:hypothetical protein